MGSIVLRLHAIGVLGMDNLAIAARLEAAGDNGSSTGAEVSVDYIALVVHFIRP
jgi:hypothetical protein